MPPPETHSRPRALRSIGFGIAVLLGAVGVWLIVTSTTQRRIEIGVLAGLWGLLLGAFCTFGARRSASHPVEHADSDEYDAPEQRVEVALRRSRELERAEEVRTRRMFEAQLQEMLRHEISASMSREVAQLRSEIAQLRSDLLEKVGGQLRLERIETTRLIGSDLEAMRAEVRRLKANANGELSGDLARGITLDPTPEPAVTAMRKIVKDEDPLGARSAPRSSASTATLRLAPPVSADVPPPTSSREPAEPPAPPRVSPPLPRIQPFVPPAAAPSPSSTPARPGPARPASERPAPAQPASAPGPSAAPTQPSGDPFADLPRLTPFTEFPLDPVDAPDRNGAGAAGYSGRRRRQNEEPAADARRDPAPPPTGRRHRRAEESQGDDVLARLLAREGMRR